MLTVINLLQHHNAIFQVRFAAWRENPSCLIVRFYMVLINVGFIYVNFFDLSITG